MLCDIVVFPMLHVCPVGEGIVDSGETYAAASSQLHCFIVCGRRGLCEAAMWRLNTCSLFSSRIYSCGQMDGQPVVFAKSPKVDINKT